MFRSLNTQVAAFRMTILGRKSRLRGLHLVVVVGWEERSGGEFPLLDVRDPSSHDGRRCSLHAQGVLCPHSDDRLFFEHYSGNQVVFLI